MIYKSMLICVNLKLLGVSIIKHGLVREGLWVREGNQGAVSKNSITTFLLYTSLAIIIYNKPLFQKTSPLKRICCCTEYLMSRMICNKGLVLFIFPLREHMFWMRF